MALLRQRYRGGLPIMGEVLALSVGAIDGYAASADANNGRFWDTKSVTSSGAINVDWGWAPGVQVGAMALGVGGIVAGAEGFGTPLLCSGAGLFFRALSFKVAQNIAHRSSGTPVPAQGHVVGHVVNVRREQTPGMLYTAPDAQPARAAVPPGIGVHGAGGYGNRDVAPGLI